MQEGIGRTEREFGMAHLSPAQLAGLPRRARYRGRSLQRPLSIDDLRARCFRRLPRMGAGYLAGGAEDEITPAGNRSAFSSFAFRPRVPRDVSSVDTTVGLLGARCPLPFGIAPTGFGGLFWHEGDQALARAAAKAGTPFAQSTVSDASIAEIARQGPADHGVARCRDGRRVEARTARAQSADPGRPVQQAPPCRLRDPARSPCQSIPGCGKGTSR